MTDPAALAQRITEAVAGKTVLRAEVLPADTVVLHFADGAALTLHGNGRKVLRQETELCGACTLAPAAMPRAPVTKGEVLASLEQALGPVPPAPAPPLAPKPPPITVAAAGGQQHQMFGAVGGGAPSKYPWHKLCEHPPFQLYVAARLGVQQGDQVRIARDFVTDEATRLTEEQAFASYTTWFYAQGRWPRETPTGEPMEG